MTARILVKPGFAIREAGLSECRFNRCGCDHAMFDRRYPFCDFCVRSIVHQDTAPGAHRFTDGPYEPALAARWVEVQGRWIDRKFARRRVIKPLRLVPA